jgi:hypothetical protein
MCSSRASTKRRAASSFAEPARRGWERGCGRLDVVELREVLLGVGDGREVGRNPPGSLLDISSIFGNHPH